jgi:hypothetical protein
MGQIKQKEDERKFIFTTKLVDDVTNKINDGVVIKRFQNPWFSSEIGLRKSGITFKMTEDEIQEYIRCKLDIHYFAEKYCKVKTEDGEVKNITLRDYQYDILKLYTENQFSILMGSRQIGKCVTFNTEVELETGKVRIGILYYTLLSFKNKLNFLQKLKITLYNLLFRYKL